MQHCAHCHVHAGMHGLGRAGGPQRHLVAMCSVHSAALATLACTQGLGRAQGGASGMGT